MTATEWRSFFYIRILVKLVDITLHNRINVN